MDSLAFDIEKYFLGRLCKKSHNWEGTGQSLRYINDSDKRCVQCTCIRNQEFIKKNANNPNKKIKNKEKRIRYELKYGSIVKERKRNWKKTERGRATTNAGTRRRRATLKSVHTFKYSFLQLEKHLQQFANKCVYCGSQENLTIDHVIAVSKGGSDVLGNIVLSCGRCNFSKADKDVHTWFSSQAFFCKKRWRNIQKIVGKNVCSGQIPLF